MFETKQGLFSYTNIKNARKCLWHTVPAGLDAYYFFDLMQLGYIDVFKIRTNKIGQLLAIKKCVGGGGEGRNGQAWVTW